MQYENMKDEWGDDADEFNVCLIGIVRSGFYIYGKENKKTTEKNSVV